MGDERPGADPKGGLVPRKVRHGWTTDGPRCCPRILQPREKVNILSQSFVCSSFGKLHTAGSCYNRSLVGVNKTIALQVTLEEQDPVLELGLKSCNYSTTLLLGERQRMSKTGGGGYYRGRS